MKPRALDLFCGAGGASMGLLLAGFDVTGIDINPQPKYPFSFIQADALRPPVDLRGFSFIWASPPCQAFTALRSLQGDREYPNLIPQTRSLLIDAGVQFAIENVEGAPLGDSGFLILLCGTMFGLQVPDGSAELRRHRLFETSFSIPLRPACQHGGRVESLSVTENGLDSNRDRWSLRSSIAVAGHSPTADTKRKRRAITITGATPQTNVITNRVRRTFSVNDARAAMGINWMSMKYLSQAIPPAYSEFIGQQAMQVLERTA